jgi:hypothetical protein
MRQFLHLFLIACDSQQNAYAIQRVSVKKEIKPILFAQGVSQSRRIIVPAH